jgi:hypothetical protein
MVDWQPDCVPWSMVDHSHKRQPNLAGARARRCSRVRYLTVGHEEQEKGTGIPTTVGTRRRRGSDGEALMKGGGGGASSMRRCSRRRGKETRTRASEVWRGGDGAPFIGSGRLWGGRETSSHRRRGVEIDFIRYKAEKGEGSQ